MGGQNHATYMEQAPMDLSKLPKQPTLAHPEPRSYAEEELERARKGLGSLTDEAAMNYKALGGIDIAELDRKQAAREAETLRQLSMESTQRMVRQFSAQQAREDDKVEYARRSAEASEAALEAEKQRTAAAIEDARIAREDARIARSHMRASLWLAAASLVLAAWALLKDQPFW